MFDLNGKKALVTGSTQGIGYEIARCLAEYGTKVFVHGANNMEKCKKAAATITNAIPVVEDLSQLGSCSRLYEKTGDVDILILNASVQVRRPWEDISEADIELQIRVDFISSLQLIQQYTPAMKSNSWGRIITVGSVQQYRPHPEMVVYAAMKEAQYSMVRNLAKQLAGDGITVNNMAPGVIKTPRNKEALDDFSYRAQVIAGIPCGFEGEAQDCAGAVLMLCGDAGRYITGTEILIDGGMHL